MNSEIKAKWVSALRSGEYAKGRGVLHRVRRDESGTESAEFCCLGVLCDLAYKAGVVDRRPVNMGTTETVFAYRDPEASWDAGDRNYLPPLVREWSEIGTHSPEVVSGPSEGLKRRNTLANLNDEEFNEFGPIADLIENQL